MTCYCYACRFLEKNGGRFTCHLRSRKEEIPTLLRGICGCEHGQLKKGAPENTDYLVAEDLLRKGWCEE